MTEAHGEVFALALVARSRAVFQLLALQPCAFLLYLLPVLAPGSRVPGKLGRPTGRPAREETPIMNTGIKWLLRAALLSCLVLPLVPAPGRAQQADLFGGVGRVGANRGALITINQATGAGALIGPGVGPVAGLTGWPLTPRERSSARR
jgi:hypothetical protein